MARAGQRLPWMAAGACPPCAPPQLHCHSCYCSSRPLALLPRDKCARVPSPTPTSWRSCPSLSWLWMERLRDRRHSSLAGPQPEEQLRSPPAAPASCHPLHADMPCLLLLCWNRSELGWVG